MNAKKVLEKCIKECRKNLDDYVREKGNEIVPELFPRLPMMTHKSLFKKNSYGIGDFLTQKITYRKLGGMVGLVAPTIGLLAPYHDLVLADKIMTGIMLVPVNVLGWAIGYAIGNAIDEKREYKKR